MKQLKQMFYNVYQFLGKIFTLLFFLKLGIKTDIMNCWAVLTPNKLPPKNKMKWKKALMSPSLFIWVGEAHVISFLQRDQSSLSRSEAQNRKHVGLFIYLFIYFAFLGHTFISQAML